MKRYDKYKSSGIDWIGEVPEHWEMTRLKHLCEIYGRIGYRGYTEADLVPESEGAITLSPSNFINGRLDYTKCSYLSWKKYYESPEIMIDNGDVIFVKTASVGKCALVTDLPKEATLNPQIVVFKKMKCNGAFLNYLCQTPVIQCQVITSLNGSTIATISQEKIGSYIFALPPLAEQEAIAAYLDARCADIDKVVATQEKRIALLQELKQSEITQAVTRGLNPDARMKDSGVEWIGMVPEHWEVCKVKHCCKDEKYAIKTGPFGTQLKGEDLKEEGPVCVYNQRNVIDDDFSSTNYFVSEEKANQLSSFYTKEKDLLITSRGTIGRCAILPDDVPMGVLHPCLIAVRVNENRCILRWLKFFINETNCFSTCVKLNSNATTIDVIYTDTLKNVTIPLPSIREQENILTYLDRRCGEIDKQIGAVTRQIELLREYKQALITEVVTGKFRV